MTTPVNRSCCRQNANGLCDSACLCQIFCTDIDTEALVSPDTLEMDEIYQVLGRDILKSSLLDDIDLYLECDEDSLYVVPHETLPSSSLPVAKSRLASRVRVSFPSSCQQVTQERIRCTQCTRSFTRESLLKDHQFQCHGARDLFPCTVCAYVGQRHRLLQKHMKRRHPSHSQQEPTLNGQQKLDLPGQQPSLIGTHSVLRKQKNISHMDSTADATCISCTFPIMCVDDPVICGTSDFSSSPLQNNIPVLSQGTDSSVPSDAIRNCGISKHCKTVCVRTNAILTNKLSHISETTSAEIARSIEQGRKKKACALEGTSDIVCKDTSNRCSGVLRCDQCCKVFQQHRSYNNHIKKHAGILMFDCTECDKHFPSKDTLGKHIKTHQTIRQHCCLHAGCRKTFKTRHALKEHMTVVHGRKSWQCHHLGCEKAYATEKDLRTHAFTHTSKHKCIECGKTFRDRYNLAVHSNAHSGVKNMACTLCDYKCVQKSSLNWHMRKKHSDSEIDTVQ